MSSRSSAIALDRLVDPLSSCLTKESAKRLLRLRADRRLEARMDYLADKCNEGELTPDERREYEMYLMANHFIAMLKAKARILLARKGQPA